MTDGSSSIKRIGEGPRSAGGTARSSAGLFRDSGGGRFGGDGDAHLEGAAMASFVVGAKDFAAVGADDAVTDAEAEAGSFGGLLGGEEGVEDALGIGDAGAVVGDGDFDEWPRRTVRMEMEPRCQRSWTAS